jgi:hypothetical protein
MDRRWDNWSLSALNLKRQRINTNPDYQRPAVWSKDKKQLLIDSILRDLDVPKIYLRRTGRNPDTYEVIDGQQRIRAIWEFFDNGYALSKEAPPVNGHGIASTRYEDLPYNLKEHFNVYQLMVVTVDCDDENQIKDMFVRLQRGERLTAAEIRHAIPGNMQQVCVDLATHQFYKSCKFLNTRYAYEQVAAQMLLLEMNGSATSVTNKVLDSRYGELARYPFTQGEGAKTVKRVKRNLDFLSRVFLERSPELSRYVSLTLYQLVSQLQKHHRLTGLEAEFKAWFFDFIGRVIRDRGLPEDQQNSELVNFRRASDLEGSIETRHKIVMKDFFLHFPNLPTLDKNRQFSEGQRLAIYRNADGMCQWQANDGNVCGRKLAWDKWEADHVKAWSEGGATTVNNGRVLCSFRNRQIGAGNNTTSDECRF